MCLVITQANAAVYSITEVPARDKYRQNYAAGINDNGDMVGIARDSYDFKFLLKEYLTNGESYLHVQCGVSDDEIESGELDVATQSCLKTELSRVTGTNSSQNFGTLANYQKVGDIVSYTFSNNQLELLNLADVHDEELNGLTKSTVEELSAINNAGLSVGSVSAPYQSLMYQQTGELAAEDPILLFSREYEKRAVVVKDGQPVFLEPEYTEFGGESLATDITDNGFVAGTESIAVATYPQSLIDSSCTEELAPKQVCYWQLARSSQVFERRAVVWQLDDNNQVVNKVQYPIGFSPSDTQSSNISSVFSTYATAVNENNVAVGYGDMPYTTASNSATNKFPMIFQNGATREILSNHDEFDGGYAYDINNNNVVVGKVQTILDRVFNDEFFVYNLDSGKFETPDTFYSTAESTATAINDAGIVVGEAEYEITTNSTRRRHGFVYDINNGQFDDINTLIECASEYEIISMQDINNNGQIVATALKVVDAQDVNGNVITGSDGEPAKQEVAVSILLDPIPGGEKEDCSAVEEPGYERKGFSSGIFTSLLLGTLVAIRRRFI